MFYYKGEEKFKIFLSKIIEWDNTNKTFILNENQEKLFQDILKNCPDFQEKIAQQSKKFDKMKSDESIKQSRSRFNPQLTSKPSKLKKDTLFLRQPSTKVKDDHGFAKTKQNQ